MKGFYLPRFNFSVRHYGGQWCMFSRLRGDEPATTDEQIAAVMEHAATNRRKFKEAQA